MRNGLPLVAGVSSWTNHWKATFTSSDWASSNPSSSNPPSNSFGQCSPSYAPRQWGKSRGFSFGFSSETLMITHNLQRLRFPKMLAISICTVVHGSEGMSCPKKDKSNMNYKSKDVRNRKNPFCKRRKHLFIGASLLGKSCLNVSSLQIHIPSMLGNNFHDSLLICKRRCIFLLSPWQCSLLFLSLSPKADV